MVKGYVAVPEFITVHLGPPDSNAENVTVSFPEYIKNVASSEIYPTWPENALRANIYAQVTFALNRIYTEYCNGTTVTCPGLSQWGTVDLANRGYTPYEILQYYYGSDIDIKAAPILPYTESFQSEPLRVGSRGHYVETVQRMLNRIGQNYPAIPRVYPVDGIYGENTEDAVRAFQRVFNLTPDGIVGEATWYKISFIYSSVKRLAELYGEGELLSDIPNQFIEPLSVGSSGELVTLLQYFINVIAKFYTQVDEIPITGRFGEETREQVTNFQRVYGIAADGIVGRETWGALYEAYRGIVRTVPQKYFNETVSVPNVGQYPGYTLSAQ